MNDRRCGRRSHVSRAKARSSASRRKRHMRAKGILARAAGSGGPDVNAGCGCEGLEGDVSPAFTRSAGGITAGAGSAHSGGAAAMTGDARTESSATSLRIGTSKLRSQKSPLNMRTATAPLHYAPRPWFSHDHGDHRSSQDGRGRGMIGCRSSQFSMTAMKSSTASHTNDNACPSAPEDHLAVSRATTSRASAPCGVRGSARLISRRDVSHRSRNSDSKGSLPKSHSLPVEDCRDRTCLSHSAWSARNRSHAAIGSPSSMLVICIEGVASKDGFA